MMKFTDFAAKVAENARLSDLIDRYEQDTQSLSEEELNEMVDLCGAIEDEEEGIYPDDDYYEDWDNLEMGFDPYMGCYSDDC